MKKEFKFGDYVHHKMHGFGVVASHVKDDCAHVRFESMEEKHIDLKDLKLVPHPDTARLDWLEMREINDQWPLIEWDDYLGKWKLKLPDDSNAYFKTLREAIDFAISEENADD